MSANFHKPLKSLMALDFDLVSADASDVTEEPEDPGTEEPGDGSSTGDGGDEGGDASASE